MTFGFSRDDAGKFLDAYYDKKIYENDPVRQVWTRPASASSWTWPASSAARPALTCTSASAASTAATPPPWSSATRVGLDYVSCSPFRVPIARLAAAQAAIKDAQ